MPPDRTTATEAFGLTETEKLVEHHLNPSEKKVFDKYIKGKHYRLVAWGKGYPDFTFRDGHKLIFREVKTGYDPLSDEQKTVLRAFRDAGYDVGVYRIKNKGEPERCDDEI
jgi:hypothetical protein